MRPQQETTRQVARGGKPRRVWGGAGVRGRGPIPPKLGMALLPNGGPVASAGGPAEAFDLQFSQMADIIETVIGLAGLEDERMVRSFLTVVTVSVIVFSSVAAQYELISGTPGGVAGNGPSKRACLSADGRYVAFDSDASDLVANDTNNRTDVFVRDRLLNVTVRASTASNGAQASGASYAPRISDDGRFILFITFASNLVEGGAVPALCMKDRVTGNLKYVTSGMAYDLSQFSGAPSYTLSRDGRYVVYQISATAELYRWDRTNSETILVLPTPGNVRGQPGISSDGRYVIWSLDESVIFRFDCIAGNWLKVTDHGSYASMSASGGTIYFITSSPIDGTDTNGKPDVYRWQASSGLIDRISLASDGAQTSGDFRACAVDTEGRCVVYGHWFDFGTVSHIDSVVLRDTATYDTLQYPDTGSYVAHPDISADGMSIAFEISSSLTALDTNSDWDVYVTTYAHPAIQSASGLIDWQFLRGPSPNQISIDLRRPNVAYPMATLSVDAGSDGSFSIPVPPTMFDISIRHESWVLRTIKGLDATSAPVVDVQVNLVNGDANRDNVVDLFDLSFMFITFGQTSQPSDVNLDGVVDLRDITVVFLNFGAVGDT